MPRTIMPNVLLEPVTHEDGSVSDPAADAVAYLLQSTQGWKPEDIPAATMSDDERKRRRTCNALPWGLYGR